MNAKSSFLSILRSTAVLGSSSVVSILIGLVSAKAWAVLLGPSGLGTMGLLQSLIGLSGLLIGMGIGTGIIRLGSSAIAREDYMYLMALYRAAWYLLFLLGSLVIIILAFFRVALADLMLGDVTRAKDVVLMGAVAVINLASGIQTSLLNASHRIAILAKIGILNSFFVTLVNLFLVWFFGEQGIVLGMILGAITSWMISRYYLFKEYNYFKYSPNRAQIVNAGRVLLRFGVPYTASLLVGTGVQIAMPILVLHTLSATDVGYYRASIAISVNYLGFLLLAMGQDYYPRVSAASDKAEILVKLVNQQHRLVMLLAVPMILGLLAFAPYLVPLIYSDQFIPTIHLLEWQLLGDILRFSSWTMGFVVLARGDSVVLFATELIAGIVAISSSWIGVWWLGLEGLGLAFLITYIVHYLVIWMIVHRDIGLVWTVENKRMMLIALVLAVIIRALPYAGVGQLRTPLAFLFAMTVGLFSLFVIVQEFGGVRNAFRAKRNSL